MNSLQTSRPRTVRFGALALVCLAALQVFATDNSVKFDFDGDGKTDISVYRPGEWTRAGRTPSTFYYLRSSGGGIIPFTWGVGGDRPAVADYDADGKADFAIHRSWDDNLEFPWDASDYWIFLSGLQTSSTIYFLGYGPIMSRNFFDGPEAEIAVLTLRLFDPVEECYMSQLFISIDGNYFSKDVSDQCVSDSVRRTLALGDYNGDGRSDLGVLVTNLDGSATNSRFEVWHSPLTPGYTTPDIVRSMRIERPVPGDYDGDLRTDFTGTFVSNGRLVWRIHYSYWNQTIEFPFGLPGDKPVPGDYDGDNRTDAAIYRPSDGTWYIWKSSDANWYVERLGVATDIPIPYTNAF